MAALVELASSWQNGSPKGNLHFIFTLIGAIPLGTFFSTQNMRLSEPAKVSSIIIVYAFPMMRTSGLARTESARSTTVCKKEVQSSGKNSAGKGVIFFI